MKLIRLLTLAILVVIFAAIGSAIAQTYSDLLNFNPNVSGPLQGGLAQGRDANLYGITTTAGIFKLTPAGTPTLLNNDSARSPWGMTLGVYGNFYGAAQLGGTHTCGLQSCGILFKMTSTGSVSVFHDFTGGSDGAIPYYPPIQASDGSFYGRQVLAAIPAHVGSQA
jgi:hypothetical protein